jgi:hypothetical protein
MSEKFIRTVEDFTCENCGERVKGNGFTNHCPLCLYSKHVDKNPGDRAMAKKCGGLMIPLDLYIKKEKYHIKHKCLKCDFEMTTRTQDEDDISLFLDKLKLTKPFDFTVIKNNE